MTSDDDFVLLNWTEQPMAEMLKRAEQNLGILAKRRTTRHFSSRDVDRRLIELAILSEIGRAHV